VLHTGYRSDPTTTAVAVPIYQTTSYQFHDTGHAVNGSLNLTRVCRYRHFESDPSAFRHVPARGNNVVRSFPLSSPSYCWVAP
jgi:cystathionine beta-lyase/cystathionine gamma-synthase